MGNATYKLLYDDEPDLPVDINKKGLQYRAHAKSKEELTGWERVKGLFELDMYGDISPEIQRCKDIILVTITAGALIGGVGRSRIVYMNFFRSNAHTAFPTPLEARAKLQETLILGFGSGAFRIGWRVGVFSTIYSISSTCMTAYRGKASVMDSCVGGTLAGFLYKFHEGPRLTLAGAAFGGILGLMGGSVTSLVSLVTGLSPDEILAQDYRKIADKRQKAYEDMRSINPPTTPHSLKPADLHAQLLEEEEAKSNTNQNSEVSSIPTPASEASVLTQGGSSVETLPQA